MVQWHIIVCNGGREQVPWPHNVSHLGTFSSERRAPRDDDRFHNMVVVSPNASTLAAPPVEGPVESVEPPPSRRRLAAKLWCPLRQARHHHCHTQGQCSDSYIVGRHEEQQRVIGWQGRRGVPGSKRPELHALGNILRNGDGQGTKVVLHLHQLNHQRSHFDRGPTNHVCATLGAAQVS